jgi:hypothetical protein
MNTQGLTIAVQRTPVERIYLHFGVLGPAPLTASVVAGTAMRSAITFIVGLVALWLLAGCTTHKPSSASYLGQRFCFTDSATREAVVKTYHLDVEEPSNEVRAAVARDFLKLTPAKKWAVLSDLWPRVRCAEFTSVLLPLAKFPDEPEAENDETFLDKVLLCLIDLKPGTVRPLILEDLKRSTPLLSLSVLLAMPDKELPDLDGVFLGHLNNGGDWLFKIAPTIERYASARIQPQVIALYRESEGRWACSIQAALLRYWLKHDRTAALRAIEHAVNLREDTRCFAKVLGETLRDSFNADTETIVLRYVNDKDRELARDAIVLLARNGSKNAKAIVIERLADIPLSNEQSEWPADARDQILCALRDATDWKPTVDQQRRIARLLSEAEKKRFRKLVSQ